jgi:spore coat polysaccharide biosynthesis protein SpsF
MLSPKTPKIVIIVQARMGSTRLPGKSMKLIAGKPMLGYVLERLQRCNYAQALVVATTTKPQDQPIVDFCASMGVECFRGHPEDLLDRYKKAADLTQATVIVRVTGDCPLIDPAIVDRVISRYLEKTPNIDYVSNTLERTHPRGMDVEVFSKEALDKAYEEAEWTAEREHVTPYIYHHPDEFRLDNVSLDKDQSHLRLTVDTPEDFKLVTLIIESLKPNFTLDNIINEIQKHPEWITINAEIRQKRLNDR